MSTKESPEGLATAVKPDRVKAEAIIQKYGFKILGIERNGEVAQAIQSFYELKVDEIEFDAVNFTTLLDHMTFYFDITPVMKHFDIAYGHQLACEYNVQIEELGGPFFERIKKCYKNIMGYLDTMDKYELNLFVVAELLDTFAFARVDREKDYNRFVEHEKKREAARCKYFKVAPPADRHFFLPSSAPLLTTLVEVDDSS